MKTKKHPLARVPRSRGRKPGSRNVVTEEKRVLFAEAWKNLSPDVVCWIREVAMKNKAKAAELALKLAEFHVPKLQRSESIGADKNITVVVQTVPPLCAACKQRHLPEEPHPAAEGARA